MPLKLQNAPEIREDIFKYASYLNFGEFHSKIDKETGLQAIVAIHNTNLGPALGGCRCIEYDSTFDALKDAMRLARGMSYKASVAGLNLGGGKSVLIKPRQIHDREAYFKAFGRFVNDLGGRYITAKDSGTSTQDMDIISTETRYVASTSVTVDGTSGDPSPATADGVLYAMLAAVKFLYQRDDLEGLHIAIQGVGAVGLDLARQLHERGVKLTVCDTNAAAAQCCADEFNAQIVTLDRIFSIDCDIFAPCALGAIINDKTIPLLNCKMVVGSANNQLEDHYHGLVLKQHGILYAPDYVANAGGLIYADAQYAGISAAGLRDKIVNLYNILLDIFERSNKENLATNIIAEKIALERINNAKK